MPENEQQEVHSISGRRNLVIGMKIIRNPCHSSLDTCRNRCDDHEANVSTGWEVMNHTCEVGLRTRFMTSAIDFRRRKNVSPWDFSAAGSGDGLLKISIW